MKPIFITKILCTASILGLLALPASADKRDPDGHGKHSHHGQKQHNEKPRQHFEARPDHTLDQSRHWQEERAWAKHGGWRGHHSWGGGRAKHWRLEHRTWVQRGGYGGYYIPRNRFEVYFGVGHPFHIHTRPVIYMGYPRFYYGGYSFLLVDPWPEDWDENWYDADEVYIEYDDGYYLYNRSRPGVALAVSVVE